MKRAAVIIGVDKTGDLPKLKDAAKGALLMETWARDQKMDAVHVITDREKPVDVQTVKTAIKELVKQGNLSQLVIYFAGHGVNRERQEYWLLSGAPDDTQEAVNVFGSVALATTCGIEHVVLISDACRTAAEGVRAQSVRGSEIFPNCEESEKAVDVFYACQLGRPSHEVRDPKVTSAEFSALYTGELVPALLGRRAEIVESSTARGKTVGRIHLRPLRDFMSSAMAARLQALQLQTKVIQVPVARIISDPPAWISEVSPPSGGERGLGFGVGGPGGPLPPPPAPTPAEVTSTLVNSALAGGTSRARGSLTPGPGADIVGAQPLVEAAERIAQPFGPMHHETGCGFKIRGARVLQAYSHRATLDYPDWVLPRGEDVRVLTVKPPGGSVLLELEGGSGAVLPAIPGFMTALTFEDGELIDVAYEPSDQESRWAAYAAQADEIRALRAIAAAATSSGAFTLEGPSALEIGRRMQYAKGVDPSLAVYAAYAYHDLQRLDLIRNMRGYMEGDLGAALFDVALLSKTLNDKTVSGSTRTLGAFPLLSQGWALLSAYRVRLPKSLAGLQRSRLPSLWTLFNQEGVAQMRRAFQSGDFP